MPPAHPPKQFQFCDRTSPLTLTQEDLFSNPSSTPLRPPELIG